MRQFSQLVPVLFKLTITITKLGNNQKESNWLTNTITITKKSQITKTKL